MAGSGFTLLNPGAGDRQINFDEVTSVKQLDKKSHTTRNVLIVAGVAVAVFALVVLVRVRAVQGLAGHY